MDGDSNVDCDDLAAERDLDRRDETVVEDLRERLDDKRATEDPTTAREAFEQEASELGVSEEAGAIGDQT